VISSPEIFCASSVVFSSVGNITEARVWILFFTGVFASAVAIWLYQGAKRTSSTGQTQQSDAAWASSAASGDDAWVPSVLHEMKPLGAAERRSQEVAQTISRKMAQVVNAQVSAVRRELVQQYGVSLEEAKHAEHVARKQYEVTLAEKRQTESVMRSIAEGLVVVDNQGRVIFINPAAERLLGKTREEKLGRPLTEEVKDEQVISLAKLAPGQDGQEIELAAKLSSTRKVVRASNAVIEDESGKTVGMVSVLTDVTKQRDLDRLKSEFVSKVTHELRTPLVAVQHSLAVMLNQTAGPLSETQQQFLSNATRNLERLNRLINDLLDVGKLEAKKLTLDRQPVSIDGVISGACEALTAWAQAKSITVEQRIQPGLPALSIDADRITQVLHNLLGNAVKFTSRRGRITVAATLAEGGRDVEISVTDTGIGISKEDISKLFQKFQQVGARAPTDMAGTGLGLAIAKEIVELHEGRIWVTSQEQQGTTFAFALPVAAPLDHPEGGVEATGGGDSAAAEGKT